MKKNSENGFNPFSFVFLRTVPKKTLISLYKTKKLVNTIAKGALYEYKDALAYAVA